MYYQSVLNPGTQDSVVSSLPLSNANEMIAES